MDSTGSVAALIGGRVRSEWQARQWTLDGLVEVSGVSRRMLIDIEQGAANPSTRILLELSDALGVGLAPLGEQPGPTAAKVNRSGDGPVLWSSKASGSAVLVASTVPPDVVELRDWTLSPGDRFGSDAHLPGTRELLHVLAVEVAVEVADQVLALQPGDALSFHGDVPRACSTSGASSARFSRSVFEPAVGTAHHKRTARA